MNKFAYNLSRQLVMAGLIGLSLVLLACTERAEYSATSDFDNPVVRQRADPWVYRTEDGQYYFTATVPEFNRIELRTASHLNALAEATPKVIWRKRWQGPMSANIWAPELHRLEDTWYIYFSAGTAGGNYDVRLYALSNESDDPMQGDWKEEGRIQTAFDAFALDATVFEHRGQRYLVWSQKDAADVRPASLHISAMASPTVLAGPEVLIAEPEHPWEMEGVPSSHGPSILIRHGKIFLTYTASATDHRSAIGLVWADADADLLDPDVWQKLSQPVFYTNPSLNRLGPGHASFTKAADGETDVMLYHSREYLDLQGGELVDPNRHSRARTVLWDENGWPLFESGRPD